MKKNFLLFVFTLLSTLTASAYYDAMIDGINYQLNTDTKQATVISGDYKGHVYIPLSVKDTVIDITYHVTSIGGYAFEGCSGLTSVTIPHSVTYLGVRAFSGCTGLKSIIIPNSVTTIRDGAFFGCKGLTSVTIPNSVTEIGGGVFSGCSSLTTVTIPNSVTSIGETFIGCDGLKSITIPNSVTSIGDYAFKNCSSLTSVTIPTSVTSIGMYAFQNCSSLTSITIPNSVTEIKWEAFRNCSSLTSIEIPNSVTDYLDLVFSYCTALTSITFNCSEIIFISEHCNSLKSITLGKDVTSVQALHILESGSGLNDVYCYAEKVPAAIYGYDSFQYLNIANITLHVPAASITDYKATYPWNRFGNIVALPDTAVRGDVNGDGKVDMDDVKYLVQKILNGKYPDEE